MHGAVCVLIIGGWLVAAGGVVIPHAVYACIDMHIYIYMYMYAVYIYVCMHCVYIHVCIPMLYIYM